MLVLVGGPRVAPQPGIADVLGTPGFAGKRTVAGTLTVEWLRLLQRGEMSDQPHGVGDYFEVVEVNFTRRALW